MFGTREIGGEKSRLIYYELSEKGMSFNMFQEGLDPRNLGYQEVDPLQSGTSHNLHLAHSKLGIPQHQFLRTSTYHTGKKT